MIIIEFYDGQGLGNQLWVYVSMRNIAKKLDMPFIVLAPEKFKAKDFLDIDFGEIHLKDEILGRIEDNNINYFKETMFLDMDLDCFCVDYDQEILNIKPFTKIDGYFQSEKYFFHDYEFYKTVLPIKSDLLTRQFIDKGTCVLNIRGGEYKNNINLILPKSYWINAIQYMKKQYDIQKFAIVTDDHEYCKKLFPEFSIIEKGIAQSYIALNQAQYLIVSNSSFSYFPIKTKSEKPNVIAPMHWARFNNELERWASPANLYQDWLWMSNNGEIFTYDMCMNNYQKNMSYYQSQYNIRTNSEITNYFNTFSIKKIIPGFIKKLFKKILPYEFAKKIALRFR